MSKKRVFVLALAVVLLAGAGLARWARVFGGPYHDYVHSAWELGDRDVLVGGDTQILPGLPVYLWLSRMSPSGAIRWQNKYFLGDDNDSRMRGLEPTEDGGCAVLSIGFWFLKLDAEGAIQWQRRYASSGSSPHGTAMKASREGGWLLGGMLWDSAVGWEVVLVKIDANGAIQWQRRYGSPDYDELMGIDQAEDGGYFLAIRSNRFGAGQMDYMIARIGSSGALQWARTYGGTDYDEIKAVRAAPDGGCYVCGRTESFSLGTTDIWLLRLSSTGSVQWQKTYGGAGGDAGTDVFLTPDGDLLVSGSTTSYGTGGGDAWALKLDADGNILWQKTYGGGAASDWADSIRPTLDGGAVVGVSGQSVGYGQMDGIVLRLHPDGGVDAGCPSTGYSIGTSSTSSRSTGVVGAVAALSSSVTSLTASIPPGSRLQQAMSTRFICESGKKGSLR